MIVSFAILVARLPQLESRRKLEHLVSRESGFLFNNLLFMGVIFATIFGVLFPMISELVRGVQITVGPPYYNRVNGPILLLLMALMGIGPLLPWRHATKAQMMRRFRWPVIVLIATAAVLGVTLRAFWPVISFAICNFTLTTLIQEYVQGISARRSVTGESWLLATARLISRARRRYGGYLVHISIIFMAFGVIGSSFFNIENGETATVGRYELTYSGFNEGPTSQGTQVQATLQVARNGREWIDLQPGKIYMEGFEEQPVSQIAIRYGLVEDLYIVLTGWEGNSATFFVFVNPLVSWIWIGGLVLVIGGLISWWPERKPKRVLEKASQGRDLLPQGATGGGD